MRADKRRLSRPRGAWTELIHFKPVEQHIRNRARTRLCDGRPASDADISSEDWSALRDARKDAILCPDCQDGVNPRDVQSDLYGYDQDVNRAPLRRAGAGRLRCDKELLTLPAEDRRLQGVA